MAKGGMLGSGHTTIGCIDLAQAATVRCQNAYMSTNNTTSVHINVNVRSITPIRILAREMLVQVDKYDPEWASQFLAIRRDLEEILKDVPYREIEHVGSTSVTGLAAKPVIDIDVILDQEHLQEAIDAFTKDGSYHFRGDLGIPKRYAFKHTEANISPKRNVYVCIDGCQALRNHLAVRDLCRCDPEVREKYGLKKLELSQKEWDSVDEYASAKTEVLNWALKRAGFDVGELDDIAKMNKKP